MQASDGSNKERRTGMGRRTLDRRKNALEAFNKPEKTEPLNAFEKRVQDDRRSGLDRRKQ